MSATPVAPLSPSVRALCFRKHCDRASTWAIGPDVTSCTKHVGQCLADLYENEPHPFAPFLPVPLRRGKW